VSALSEHLFELRHGGRCFLYAPLVGTLLEVNEAALAWLDRCGDHPHDQRDPFSMELEAAGLLAGHPPHAPAQASCLPAGALSLFVTQACTLRCVYCYGRGGSGPATLSAEVALAAIDHQVHALAAQRPGGTLRLAFHGGGEPTAAFDLLRQCVRHAWARTEAAGLGLRLSLGTNGVMPPEHARWVATNLHEATLSLDGGPGLHDRQRPRPDGGPSHAAVVATAALWDRWGFDYGLRATVLPAGARSLPEVVEALCFACAARSIKVEPVFAHGRAADRALPAPDPADFVAGFLEARRVAARQGRRLTYSALRIDQVCRTFCSAAGRSFCVTPAGGVTSCYEVADPADPRAEAFFFGAWDSHERRFRIDPERRRAQQRLCQDTLLDCSRCFCRWHCAGDCPAKWSWHVQGEGARPRADAGRCAITRELSAALLVQRLDGAAPSPGEGATVRPREPQESPVCAVEGSGPS